MAAESGGPSAHPLGQYVRELVAERERAAAREREEAYNSPEVRQLGGTLGGRYFELPHVRRRISLNALESAGARGVIVLREVHYPSVPRLRNFFDGNPLPGRRALILPSDHRASQEVPSASANAWLGSLLGPAGGSDMADQLAVTFDPSASADGPPCAAYVAHSLEAATRASFGEAWFTRQHFQDVVIDLVTIGGDAHGETKQVDGAIASLLTHLRTEHFIVLVGRRSGLASLSRRSCAALLSLFVTSGRNEAADTRRREQIDLLDEGELRRLLHAFVVE